MKLTKKLESEIMKAYHAYWDAYLKGDVKTMSYWLHDDVQMIGSGMGEFFKNKKETIKYCKSTAAQVAGKADMRNRKITVMPVGAQLLVSEECDFFVLIDSVWTFYGPGRISTLFVKTIKGWRIIEEHVSIPDVRTAEGEPVNTDKIKAENIRLKEAVKRRTIELEEKNHELKIEAALERVRSRAMAMRTSDELKEVAKEMRNQLHLLGQKELETCAIHLWSESSGQFEAWAALRSPDNTGKIIESESKFKIKGIKILEENFQHYRDGKKDYVLINDVAKAKNFFEALKQVDPKAYAFLSPTIKNKKSRDISAYWSVSDFTGGSLVMVTMNPPEENSRALLRRFADVFGLAYRRFSDLKKAEAQAREAQIEAALEKVRSGSLAMHRSDELQTVVNIVIERLKELNIVLDTTNILIFNDKEKIIEYWTGSNSTGTQLSASWKVPYANFLYYKAIRKARENKEEIFTGYYSFEEKRKMFNYLFEETDFRNLSPERKKFILDSPRATIVSAIVNDVAIQVISYSRVSFATDEIEIVKRFAKVFNQAYTRFLDLQKAEAQAREAQIQLALERVRARTMAMQKSDELGEVATLLFQQVKSLGIETYSSGFTVWENNDSELISWMCNADGSINPPFRMPAKEIEWHRQQYESWKKKEDFIIHDFTGKEMKNHYMYLRSFPLLDEAFKKSEAASVATPERQVHNAFNFSKGNLLFITLHPVPEFYEIFKRFAKVFEQTYTRFLDLQKAEAQSRESQIQLALERVRASTMAMQRSDDMNQTASEMFKQIQALGIQPWACGFNIFDEDEKAVTQYMSLADGGISPPFRTPLTEDPFFINIYDARQRRDELLVMESSGKSLAETYRYMFSLSGSKEIFGDLENSGFEMPKFQITHCAYFSQGYLVFITYEQVSRAHDIFKRFAKVFEQTYTRFLDLQKAESQTREAQIQLALERVRARTMAMQRSDELPEAATILFQQMQTLSMPAWSAGYCIWNEDKSAVTLWMSSEGVLQPPFTAPTTEDELFIQMRKGQEEGKTFHVVEMGGEKLVAHYKYMRTLPVVGKILDSIINEGHPLPTFQIMHQAYFSQGFLLFITYEPVPEAHDIFKRFAKVFEQTYTRFLDLQKAEAQAREAQIQLALERVRARTMAMQKSEELKETTLVLFQQFKSLGATTAQVSICLFDEEAKNGEMFLTLKGEKIDRSFKMELYKETFVMQKVAEAFLAKQKNFSITVKGKKLQDFNRWRNKVVGKKNWDESDTVRKQEWHVNVVFFSGGMMGISSGATPSEEALKLLERFAKVFDQTYTRFHDLQKAEAQAREAQIEIGLERVRAKAMAMQHSGELADLVAVLFKELTALGFPLTSSIIWIHDQSNEINTVWISSAELKKPSKPYNITPFYHDFFKSIIHAWKARNRKWNFDLTGKPKKDFEKAFFKEIPGLPTPFKKALTQPEQVIFSASFNNFGALEIVATEPLSEDKFEILHRFGKVFDLSYTRFNDLQKAEAQAREAQIEAALEKVRSRSMGMQKSEELKDVINLVYEQLAHLNIHVEHAGFLIDYKTRDDLHIWLADEHLAPSEVIFPWFDCPPNNAIRDAKDKGEDFFFYHLNFEEKNKFYRDLFNLIPGIPQETINYYLTCAGLAGSGVLLESIGLYIENFSGTDYTEEENAVLMRFGKVFQQTYTRFLDLQKAEAQAREAQIEAALERVRARTMAMQKSSELNPTADLLFEQLRHLGAELQGVAFAICDKDSDIVQKWTSIGVFSFPYTIEPAEQNMYEAWKNHIPLYEEVFEGERIKKYYETLMEVPAFKQGLQQLLDAGVPMPTWQKNHAVSFQQGYLLVITTKPFAETQIFIRFGKVFEQTYTRFLDLQKAEAQTRESQIQLALERVRASTMSMQKSEDLKVIVKVVFEQFKQLDFVMEGGAAHIGIFDDSSKIYSQWSANGEAVESYKIPYNDHPVFADVLNAKHNGEDFLYKKYSFAEKNSWFDWAFVHSDFKQLPDEIKKALKESKSYAHWTSFQKDSLITVNNFLDNPLTPEQISILKRFAEVFEQAYTRFLDLQKAEAAAKEAVKQAALDRIRADIAAMRTVSDLERIIPLIWNELTILGIPFIRCGVFIMDDEKELIHTFLSTPDGKAIAAIHIPYDTPGKIKLIPQNWRKNQKYTDHWNDPDFIDFANALLQQHAIASADQYLSGVPHGGFYLHFVPFLQGMLYVGNSSKLGDDEIDITQSVADAFSTAYARYEDFNKLEAAKKQVDSTLNELQSTQKQLIQSEKMASLGELTAGIAHEIQNPLNFVNNFSEVSNELIEELRTCLAGRQVKNYELKIDDPEINELLNDIRQNLEKINHHGKRADAIVKGMLQHSQKSTGQKELTDINALSDEYLRLSYHGMRAKDKNFNCEMKTDFDESIGKINIVPQDIGRVILNLINNAFYAVNEKKKLSADSYQPTAKITTRKIDDKVEIIVSDNGNGIPDKIKDKIFQPFFTTKPTGSGTGLGLSLSYDIVKAHGGEIKVTSKENVGTEFIIKLPV